MNLLMIPTHLGLLAIIFINILECLKVKACLCISLIYCIG